MSSLSVFTVLVPGVVAVISRSCTEAGSLEESSGKKTLLLPPMPEKSSSYNFV